MKRILTLITLLGALAPNSFAGWAPPLPELSAHEGTYALSSPSDFYCKGLAELQLSVSGTSVSVYVTGKSLEGKDMAFTEEFPGVNTDAHTVIQYINAITGYIYNVFENDALKVQERDWFMNIIPSEPKDNRVVLKLLDENTMEYNYSSFGTTKCRFVRKSN